MLKRNISIEMFECISNGNVYQMITTNITSAIDI